MNAPARRGRGFTVIELIVVVAIAGVVLVLAAPSFTDYLQRQRLKGIHAQLLTDLQFTRSHAAATGLIGRIVFRAANDGSMTCYSIFVVRPVPGHQSIRCDCLREPPTRCQDNAIEARTVRVPGSLGIRVLATTPGLDGIGFDPVDGSVTTIPNDDFWRPLESFDVDTGIDSSQTLRTTVVRPGRATVCATGDHLGAPRC